MRLALNAEQDHGKCDMQSMNFTCTSHATVFPLPTNCSRQQHSHAAQRCQSALFYRRRKLPFAGPSFAPRAMHIPSRLCLFPGSARIRPWRMKSIRFTLRAAPCRGPPPQNQQNGHLAARSPRRRRRAAPGLACCSPRGARSVCLKSLSGREWSAPSWRLPRPRPPSNIKKGLDATKRVNGSTVNGERD